MSHPTPASHKVLTRPAGRGPGIRSASSPGMFLTWTTVASTGLTWGRSEPGALSPSPRPAEQESALEQVTAGQGRVQEAAPEIWPLLTAPWSPSSSWGSSAPAPLGASPLSGHAELAPGPGPCLPLCRVLTPWPWRGCLPLPSRPPRAPVTLCSQQHPGMSAPWGQGSRRPCSPLSPRVLS